jgi:hypothetical protein
VFFRSDSFSTAWRILHGMTAIDTVPAIPELTLDKLTSALGDPMQLNMLWPLVAASATIAFVFPNSNQITAAVQNLLEGMGRTRKSSTVVLTAAAFGTLLGIGVVAIGRATQFLYFQF